MNTCKKVYRDGQVVEKTYTLGIEELLEMYAYYNNYKRPERKTGETLEVIENGFVYLDIDDNPIVEYTTTTEKL